MDFHSSLWAAHLSAPGSGAVNGGFALNPAIFSDLKVLPRCALGRLA